MKPLPWAFYFDVAGLVMNGFALAIAMLVHSTGLLLWHGFLGLCFTLHLAAMFRSYQFANCKMNIGDENDQRG